MADIQAPDLETKLAILDHKAEELSLSLSHKVRIYLATHLKSNIRELEGVLTRLMAIASLTRSEVTLEMAKQTLESVTASGGSRATLDKVLRVVAEHFGLELAQLKERTNTRSIAYPRQIAMYLAKELLDLSLPDIGKAFAGKHHTTVLHAVRKIESQRRGDQEIDTLLQRLTDRIN